MEMIFFVCLLYSAVHLRRLLEKKDLDWTVIYLHSSSIPVPDQKNWHYVISSSSEQ